MIDREYDGDSLDVSWDSPPWASEGETVDVVDSSTHSEKSPPERIKTVVDGIRSSGALPYSDARMDFLERLDECHPEGKTTVELSESLNRSRSTVQHQVNVLPDGLIVSREVDGSHGGQMERTLLCPLDTIRRELASDVEFSLPEQVDPLKTTKTQRQAIGLMAAHPTISANRVADRIGTTTGVVTRALDKFGLRKPPDERDQSPPTEIIQIGLQNKKDREAAARAWQLKKDRGDTWAGVLRLLLESYEDVEPDAVADGGDP